MVILNNTSEKLIAFAWHTQHGYGKDIEIEPGQFGTLQGPYIGEMGGGKCYLSPGEGQITCHEKPDDEENFHVSVGNQLYLQDRENGMSVRHYSEERDVE